MRVGSARQCPLGTTRAIVRDWYQQARCCVGRLARVICAL